MRKAFQLIVCGNEYLTCFTIPVNRSIFTIGRSNNCSLHLNDLGVSRCHATIAEDELTGDRILYDGNPETEKPSTNGILFRGKRLDCAIRLRPGDEFLIGSYTFKWQFRLREDEDAKNSTIPGWQPN